MNGRKEIRETLKVCHRNWAEVDLDAVVENMQQMKKNVAENVSLMGVIKTDGYGHGAVPIAQCLEPIDYVFGFGVATEEEAFELRKAGIKKPILILGYTFPSCYKSLAEHEIRPAVFREDMPKQLAEAAREAGRRIKVHVKVDTGMGRIGITPDSSGIAFLKKLMKYPELEIEGIFTHFARADETDKTNAMEQLYIFQEFVLRAEKELDLHIPLKHCANSAGILELTDTGMDLMRAGISLYGMYPSDEVDREKVHLRPALSWYSRVVFLKDLEAGKHVSYGGTFTAEKPMRIATVPVGYGDGYPRSLSNKGYVLLHGRKAPILGRICMDQMMIDVTDIPDVRESDVVTLIGAEEGLEISAEMLGELSGRFHYELVCCISKRVPRIYIREGNVTAVKEY